MTEADLNDVYSNMTCGIIAEASTKPLDPSVQDVITTVAKAVENGTTDVIATPDTMGATSSSQRPGSYNASQDSFHAKRLKASFPYGKSSLVSLYAKLRIRGLPYAYGDPRMHTGGDC